VGAVPATRELTSSRQASCRHCRLHWEACAEDQSDASRPSQSATATTSSGAIVELDCIIAGISQDMNFDENVTMTFLLIRLPDGKQFRAAIDDPTAAAVVALSVAQNGQPRAAMRPSSEPESQYHPTQPEAPEIVDPPPPVQNKFNGSLAKAATVEEPAPRIFGGQDGGDDADPAYEEEEPAVEQPVARANLQRKNGKIVVPSRTVPMSNYGYPVVQSSGVDPSSMTSTNNQNDDGVGSV
jgi:hypothetical protein